VTRRTVIMAGAPQYAGVAMAATIMPAVAQASTPARDTYSDAVGHRFEAASEYGHYELTLASVEPLNAVSGTRFGLMFTASVDTPPAGVYRLSVADDALSRDELPDAQLFVVRSRKRRRPASLRPTTTRFTGPRP
jgi:hypothetical protein